MSDNHIPPGERLPWEPDESIVDTEETSVATEAPAPKKRGRPAGSKNKPKAIEPGPMPDDGRADHYTDTVPRAEVVDPDAQIERADPDDYPIPAEVVEEEKGLISYQPPAQTNHHIVTGMAMLARMDDAEFEQALQAIERGQSRIREFQDRAMTKGEDYGVVKGIDRPFLHLPGAEKLSLLYGLAVRQEAERIVGVERPGFADLRPEEQERLGRWLSPPLAYHVKSYVHVGSFDGPIVAMGYGEANSWEEKYRYRWERPTCPKCGRAGLMKRKSPPQLAGKMNCPNFGNFDGCGEVYEPNDPRIGENKRVENNDPHSLAETLIQMSAKRSFVASMRRATGTSGFFTQDDDSPSVRQQSNDSGGSDDDGSEPVVKRVESKAKVAAGGKTEKISTPQIREIIALSKENDLGEAGIARLLRRALHIDVNDAKKAISDAVKALTAAQAAIIIHAIKTGEVPEEEATPGFPPQSSDEM